MGSVGPPQGLVPYENVRDCSQGFCSFSCPQWCYIIFPPPPPFGFSDDDSSGTNFSPLVIAIIGILASAFLIVSYYTVISKYCGNLGSSSSRTNSDNNNESNENNQEPWQIPNTGLDEALIKTITVCKYSKKDGFIDGTDCSVCLSEFQENESLRLLPKCSHAFHLSCIDTWLKSHANCPLCRANIVCTSPAPLPSVQDDSSQVCEQGEELERSSGNGNRNVSSSASVVGDSEENNNDTIIEIRDEAGVQQIRRSISMGNMSRGDRLSIADILCDNQDEHCHHDSHITEEHGGFQEGTESSSSRKQNVGSTANKLIHTRSKVLHCVMSPVTMKRSTSSGGRFLFGTRHGRSSSRNLDTLPL